MRSSKGFLVLLAVTTLLVSPSVDSASATPVDLETGSPVRSADFVRAAKPVPPERVPSAPGVAFLESDLECTIGPPRTTKTNVNLDCDAPRFPNNEPHVIVDPADPDHIVVSSNDYDSNGDQFYVTFNGGAIWRTGDMAALSAARFGSDPVTAIDPVTGNVLHSTLNFLIGRDGLDEGHVVVSVSTDGGVHWNKPKIVGEGIGDDDDPLQIFHDKEWLVVDTFPASPFYGRAYLVWAAFKARFGNYKRSPILESHSDDGGITWSAPQEISGTNALCTFQITGPKGKCDEAEFPTVTVAPDGTVHVAFLSPQNKSAWEAGERFDNTYFAVQSGDGGATWTDPVVAATLEDGTRDFPKNVFRLPTLSGYQLRIPSGGNIAASPMDGTLYLVWTDNRNGRHDVDNPKTKTDVFVVSSADGVTWSAPTPITTKKSDQWFPFVDVDPTSGDVGIVYHDRRIKDPKRYDTRLAEGDPGSFTIVKLNTKASNPVRSAHFRARVAGCWKCAYFHGDYIGLDYGSDGSVHTAWTDMRRTVTVAGGEGKNETIYFRRL